MSMSLPLHESTFAPRGASAVSESSVAPSPAVASAAMPVAAPRFSLLGLILLTSLTAVLCGAIFAMPFEVGTLVLLVVNLCFAPIALSAIVFGQGHLRAAAIGLILPGLLAWTLTGLHFQAVASAVDQTPSDSRLLQVYPSSGYAVPMPAYMPASSAPPSEAPTLEPAPAEPPSQTTSGDPAPNGASLPPGAYGSSSSPYDPYATQPQPLPPPPGPMIVQQTVMEYIDPDFYHLRVFLTWNAPLALLCVACAVGTKWFGDSQPAA